MQRKPIHIVFQVLNFIHSDISNSFKLLPIDKLILINLASHKGKRGICPSVLKIAKELKITKRHVITRLGFLESLKLISTMKTMGKRTHYTLSFIEATGEPQITSELQYTGELQFTQPVNYSTQTGELQFTQVTNNNLITNKELKDIGHSAVDDPEFETVTETSEPELISNIPNEIALQQDHSDPPAHPPPGFEEFWEVYPVKKKKKKAEQIWKRDKLDEKAEIIIADVSNRKEKDQEWLEGYIPHPTTYLNGERWNDEITEQRNGSHEKSNPGYVQQLTAQQAREKADRDSWDFLAKAAGYKGIQDFDGFESDLPSEIPGLLSYGGISKRRN